ncbi:MAG: hypothetical protein HY822_11460 [Acidobacteria bacterium]|nr:hypothetical protein [Acidobacteriota bacterium]
MAASGELTAATIPAGGLHSLGTVRLPPGKLAAPARYSIEVSVGGFANHWDFWVYPATLPASPPGEMLTSRAWDETARSALREGRRVLLLAPAGTLANAVPVSFTTSFWSLRWFPKRPETMGILCDPKHPALADFPTRSHSDWQWWDLLSRSQALILSDAPPAYRPIVQVIDDPTRNHKLGAVFEARVGAGKLLVSTFELESSLESRPAGRVTPLGGLSLGLSRFARVNQLKLELLIEGTGFANDWDLWVFPVGRSGGAHTR